MERIGIHKSGGNDWKSRIVKPVENVTSASFCSAQACVFKISVLSTSVLFGYIIICLADPSYLTIHREKFSSTRAGRRDACRYCLHQYSAADLQIMILSAVLLPGVLKNNFLWYILEIHFTTSAIFHLRNRFSSWIYLRPSFFMASDIPKPRKHCSLLNSEKIGAVCRFEQAPVKISEVNLPA